jgi:hypothetical protein
VAPGHGRRRRKKEGTMTTTMYIVTAGRLDQPGWRELPGAARGVFQTPEAARAACEHAEGHAWGTTSDGQPQEDGYGTAIPAAGAGGVTEWRPHGGSNEYRYYITPLEPGKLREPA